MESWYNTCIDTQIENTMTKAEMIDYIAETSVEAMDIGELMAYAQEMMVKELTKQSKAEIQDQYEYLTN